MKIESETGVKSDTPFCSWLPIKKTNSVRYTTFLKKALELSRLPQQLCRYIDSSIKSFKNNTNASFILGTKTGKIRE